MRVLYVDLDREWRGGQSQAWLTVSGMRELGHDAHLLAVRDSLLARRAEGAGVPVHTVEARVRRARAVFLLRKLLRRESFDILHANEPHALTAAWLAGVHKKLAVVVSRRVTLPLPHRGVALKRYEAARRILAISECVKKKILESGIDAEKVRVVYEGVEVPPEVTREARQHARQRWAVNETDLLLGCIGYLVPQKGHESGIRSFAAARVKVPSARLLLAGDGPRRKELEELAERLGVSKAVIFAGFVENVAQVYAALDLFLFPSLGEGLGTSLMAAMAWGLPVLAMASGGVPEYVEDSVNGLLVANAHADLLSAGLIRLLSDKSLRERLGQAARRTMEGRFTTARMVENTIHAYKEVLKEMPSGINPR